MPREIKAANCTLRKINKDDYKDFFLLHSDNNIRKFLGGALDKETIDARFSKLIKSEDYYWAIADNNSLKFIGEISLDKHHDSDNLEVTYLLSQKFWGKGHAQEALRSVISYAFIELKLPLLLAETQSANLASCKLLDKVGFKLKYDTIRFGEKQSVYEILA